MHDWSHGPGRFPTRDFTDWMRIGFIQALVWLLVVAAAILLLAWLLRRVSRERAPVTSNQGRASLDERYARGELTREEYRAMRRDLARGPRTRWLPRRAAEQCLQRKPLPGSRARQDPRSTLVAVAARTRIHP